MFLPTIEMRTSRLRNLLLIATLASLTVTCLFAIRESTSSRIKISVSSLFSGHRRPPIISQSESSDPDYTITNSQIHLLVPANAPDANLCKNVVSSTILGYPTSTVLNWGTYYEWQNSATGSHIAKLSKVHDYLSALPSDSDDDLVILVDGYDIWFQLPLQILLDRYFDLNERANNRIAQQIGRERLESDPGVKQTIVVGTQKKCWPGDENDYWCWAVPASPLMDDLYGPETDKWVADGEGVEDNQRWQRWRRRFVNSGIVIGPVGDMRRLYGRLLEVSRGEMEGELHDQAVLANVFGMQEFERHVWVDEAGGSGKGWVRRRDGGDVSEHGLSDDVPVQEDSTDRQTTNSADVDSTTQQSSAEDKRRKPTLHSSKSYQYNLGLDYGTHIGIATVFSELDFSWFAYNNGPSFREAYTKANVSLDLPPTLSPDLQKAEGPFPSSSSEVDVTVVKQAQAIEKGWDSHASWGDMNLYTDLFTGTTPAIIHHNAHYNNQKENRVNHWDRIWFQPYARGLLDHQLRLPRDRVLATRKWGNGRGETRFWDVERALGGKGWEGGSVKGGSNRFWGKFGFGRMRQKGEGVNGVGVDGGEGSGMRVWGVMTDNTTIGEDMVPWSRLCDVEMQVEVFRDEKGRFDESVYAYGGVGS